MSPVTWSSWPACGSRCWPPPTTVAGTRWLAHGPPALGFRVSNEAGSFWYPGDTELRDDMADVEPVDLALVPVGGWGPTLATGHLDPDEAAAAVRRVGARWAVPVHWGTFWPFGLRRVARANHERLFTTPGRGSQRRSPAPVSRPWCWRLGSGPRAPRRPTCN